MTFEEWWGQRMQAAGAPLAGADNAGAPVQITQDKGLTECL